MQSQLVSAHGMLAILEVLEDKSSRDVTLKLLQIVNTVRTTLVFIHVKWLILRTLYSWWLLTWDSWRVSVWLGMSLCIICYLKHCLNTLMQWYSGHYGSVTRVCKHDAVLIFCLGFTSKKYPSECRLEASHFIRLLCHSSVLTLQMFIS